MCVHWSRDYSLNNDMNNNYDWERNGVVVFLLDIGSDDSPGLDLKHPQCINLRQAEIAALYPLARV